jgi:hypothetical protein
LEELILPAHLFACFFMTGLIWVIQIVHYPSFGYFDEVRFAGFHAFHSSRITWIVLPMMTLELLTGIALVAQRPDWFLISNLLGLVGIWLATALLSVPLHNRLAEGFSDSTIARLVLTNWPRTILWSFRSLFLLSFVNFSLPG